MEHKEKCIKIFVNLIYIIPVFIIMAVCLYHLHDNRIIKITGDEYGYWAAGGYLAGLDWSDVTSINAYYGYGYGFILAIILRCTSSMVTAYQAAVILNVFSLCCIYVIALKLVKAFSAECGMPWYLEIILSFTTAVYTSNVVYTQYTLSEALLAFLYWLLVYLAYLLLQRFTYVRALFFGFIAVYALSVHMRTVGILLVCCAFLVYLFCRNHVKLAKSLPVFGAIAVLLIAFYALKSIYQGAWFAGGDDAVLAANEVSGQIGKLEYFLSAEGFLSFLTVLSGKLFSSLSSTLLVIGVGFAVFLRNICCLVKGGIIEKKQCVFSGMDRLLFFLVFSSLIMMGIGSLYMIEPSGRFDLLTYGRYFEFTLSPLILISFLYLYGSGIRQLLKYIVFIMVCYVPLSLFINHVQDYSLPKGNVFISCTGISSTLMKLEYKEDAFLFFMTRGMAVFIVLLCIVFTDNGKWKRLLYSVALSAVGIFWIYSAMYNYRHGCLEWAVPMQEAELGLAEYIEKENIGDKLYYYYPEDILKADVLQFLLKDNEIQCIDEVSGFRDTHGTGYLLTPKQTGIGEELKSRGFRIVQETKLLKLWKCDSS